VITLERLVVLSGKGTAGRWLPVWL
ncbi:uncharacterized protein METZ01_LOCUS262498, partial [marine metagenome]